LKTDNIPGCQGREVKILRCPAAVMGTKVEPPFCGEPLKGDNFFGKVSK